MVYHMVLVLWFEIHGVPSGDGAIARNYGVPSGNGFMAGNAVCTISPPPDWYAGGGG